MRNPLVFIIVSALLLLAIEPDARASCGSCYWAGYEMHKGNTSAEAALNDSGMCTSPWGSFNLDHQMLQAQTEGEAAEQLFFDANQTCSSQSAACAMEHAQAALEWALQAQEECNTTYCENNSQCPYIDSAVGWYQIAVGDGAECQQQTGITECNQ